jgi:DNA repair protein RecO (recombination protein O)
MRAIALHSIPTNDKGGVVKLFTEDHGVRPYYVTWGKNPMLFQAMTLLEIEERERRNGSMRMLSEVRRSPSLHYLAANPIKSAIALFMAEVLHRALAEDQAQPELFTWCHLSMQALDLDERVSSYPLLFLCRVIVQLGFEPPARTAGGGAFFDLIGSEWLHAVPLHGMHLEGAEADQFVRAVSMSRDELETSVPQRDDRRRLLEHLLRYLQIHLHSEREVRSFEVLREVFN